MICVVSGCACVQGLDADFVTSILTSLPGVDLNDPALQTTLQNLRDSEKPKQDEEKKDQQDGDRQ